MSENNDGQWRCPKCQVEAVVEGLKISVRVSGYSWPLHPDCELANDIDHIDFSKLEKVT